jgi:hypothetical protein
VGFYPPLNFSCSIFQGFDVFALVFRVLDIVTEAVGEMLATHQPVFHFLSQKIQHILFFKPPPFGNYSARINEEYVMI